MKKALLIIDLQNGLQTETKRLFEIEDVLLKVNQRIIAYREVNKPIIFVQHIDDELVRNTKSWELMPELNAYHQTIILKKRNRMRFIKPIYKKC